MITIKSSTTGATMNVSDEDFRFVIENMKIKVDDYRDATVSSSGEDAVYFEKGHAILKRFVDGICNMVEHK